MLEKVNISQVQSTGEDGLVESVEGHLVTRPPTDDMPETLSGVYDQVTGTLTLRIPTIGTLNIEGLPRTADMGQGEQGRDGPMGTPGVAGLTARDGRRGPDGCLGPEGREGEPGRQGPRGREGPQGYIGIEGPKGPTGADARPNVYYQNEDPGAVGPGAIWIRPKPKADMGQ